MRNETLTEAGNTPVTGQAQEVPAAETPVTQTLTGSSPWGEPITIDVEDGLLQKCDIIKIGATSHPNYAGGDYRLIIYGHSALLKNFTSVGVRLNYKLLNGECKHVSWKQFKVWITWEKDVFTVELIAFEPWNYARIHINPLADDPSNDGYKKQWAGAIEGLLEDANSDPVAAFTERSRNDALRNLKNSEKGSAAQLELDKRRAPQAAPSSGDARVQKGADSSRLIRVYSNEKCSYYIPEHMINSNLDGAYPRNGNFHVHLYEEFNQVMQQEFITALKRGIDDGTIIVSAGVICNPDVVKYQVLNVALNQNTKVVSLKETIFLDVNGSTVATQQANETFVLDAKKYQTLSNAIHGIIGILEEAKNRHGINYRSQTPPNNPDPRRQGEPQAKPTAAQIIEQLRSRGNQVQQRGY
jgi:hypothetical protein